MFVCGGDYGSGLFEQARTEGEILPFSFLNLENTSIRLKCNLLSWAQTEFDTETID